MTETETENLQKALPDLMAACKRLVDEWDNDESVSMGCVEDAHASIAVAHGQKESGTPQPQTTFSIFPSQATYALLLVCERMSALHKCFDLDDDFETRIWLTLVDDARTAVADIEAVLAPEGKKREMTPTAAALFKFTRENSFSGTAQRIARLMMSMHNGQTRISFWHGLHGFDGIRNAQVAALIQEYLTGGYRDGDFTTVAEWLIADGYLDDDQRDERAAWIQDHWRGIQGQYNALPNSQRNGDSNDYVSFEEFCNEQWKGALLDPDPTGAPAEFHATPGRQKEGGPVK